MVFTVNTPFGHTLDMMNGNWLIEHCPSCRENVSTEFVREDEPTDDINVREKRREYRETQKGNNPYKHLCGTNLIPLIKV